MSMYKILIFISTFHMFVCAMNHDIQQAENDRIFLHNYLSERSLKLSDLDALCIKQKRKHREKDCDKPIKKGLIPFSDCIYANIEFRTAYGNFITFPLKDLLKNNSWVCMMEKCNYTTCFERKVNFFKHLKTHFTVTNTKRFSCGYHEGCAEKFKTLREWITHYKKSPLQYFNEQ